MALQPELDGEGKGIGRHRRRGSARIREGGREGFGMGSDVMRWAETQQHHHVVQFLQSVRHKSEGFLPPASR